MIWEFECRDPFTPPLNFTNTVPLKEQWDLSTATIVTVTKSYQRWRRNSRILPKMRLWFLKKCTGVSSVIKCSCHCCNLPFINIIIKKILFSCSQQPLPSVGPWKPARYCARGHSWYKSLGNPALEDSAHLPWEVSGRAGMNNIRSGMLWPDKSCDNLWRISPSITLSEREVAFLDTSTAVRSSEDCVECWKVSSWWISEKEDEMAPGWPDASTINATSLSPSLRLTAHASTWGKFSMTWGQK